MGSAAGAATCRRRRSPGATLPAGSGTLMMVPAGMASPGTVFKFTDSSSRRLALLRLAIDSRVSPGLAWMVTLGGGHDNR